MKFSVYGRLLLEVQREQNRWTVYRLDAGKRNPAQDVVLPPELPEAEIATFLDDLFHELSRPGDSIRRMS